MILWSGSGCDWAKTWGEKLGLAPFEVRMKQKSEDIDIAFDDCDVDLGRVNVKVKRLNNGISRKDWNKNKITVGEVEESHDKQSEMKEAFRLAFGDTKSRKA